MPKEAEVVLVLESEGVRLPANLVSLAQFRRWARSDRFPERGRIDWLGHEVEIDLSPEDLNTHASPKSAIAGDLRQIVEERDLGVVYIDRARLSNASADLSCEPDVVVLLFESIEQGRAPLVPNAGGAEGRYVEIEGAVDLVVECVSDSSERKDRTRLGPLFHKAGVPEFWLVDARGEEIKFQLFRRTPARYREERPDAEGFRASHVLGGRVRLARRAPRQGLVRYRLEHRPA